MGAGGLWGGILGNIAQEEITWSPQGAPRKPEMRDTLGTHSDDAPWERREEQKGVQGFQCQDQTRLPFTIYFKRKTSAWPRSHAARLSMGPAREPPPSRALTDSSRLSPDKRLHVDIEAVSHNGAVTACTEVNNSVNCRIRDQVLVTLKFTCHVLGGSWPSPTSGCWGLPITDPAPSSVTPAGTIKATTRIGTSMPPRRLPL